MPAFSGTRGALATALLLSAAACSNPTLKTDLNPNGPPNVLDVNVLSSGAGGTVATWCTQDASLQQYVNTAYCTAGMQATAVADAPPTGWYLRVVFDKLLDPSIETLTTTMNADGTMTTTGDLSKSKPFKITCGGTDVGYVGFYDPSGNNVTTPPGPGLVAQIDYPNSFGATGSKCSVMLDTTKIKDKKGDALPSSEAGPYTFTIAPMAIDMANTVPADGDTGVDPTMTLPVIPFNAPVDMASLKDSSGNSLITLTSNGNAVPASVAVDANDATQVVITPTNGLKANTMYTVTVAKSGIKDIAGGALTMSADFSFSFTTGTAMGPDGGMGGMPDGAPSDGTSSDGAPAD